MSGAWAIVSSEHPGEMFLTLCVERSSSRGLRIYHTSNWHYDRASKLLRHLVSLQSLRHVLIDLVSVNIENEGLAWSGASTTHQREMSQLLGRLDNQALSRVNIEYLRAFRYSNADDALEGGEDELDGTGIEIEEGV